MASQGIRSQFGGWRVLVIMEEALGVLVGCRGRGVGMGTRGGEGRGRECRGVVGVTGTGTEERGRAKERTVMQVRGRETIARRRGRVGRRKLPVGFGEFGVSSFRKKSSQLTKPPVRPAPLMA